MCSASFLFMKSICKHLSHLSARPNSGITTLYGRHKEWSATYRRAAKNVAPTCTSLPDVTPLASGRTARVTCRTAIYTRRVNILLLSRLHEFLQACNVSESCWSDSKILKLVSSTSESLVFFELEPHWHRSP